MEKSDVRISVRDIVEFVLRSGSIDSQYMGMKRAQEGTRIHQKIQRQRAKEALLNGNLYESEVSLKFSFAYKDFSFHLEGRADGILKTKGVDEDVQQITIEEIKSTAKSLDEMEENPDHWHWAQAKCYGYMYAVLYEKQDMAIFLTYVQLETEQVLIFERKFTVEELELFFYGIIEKYYRFAQLDYERIQIRNETGKALEFPYPDYRKSQRQFAVAVYKTIQQNKLLFAQAPTGTGKTISTIFPGVKALAEGLASKIFYLTAKTITRQVAEEAFHRMFQNGLVMRNVTLTAKDKICFCKGAACNPRECSYADGHFDRVNEAIYDIIKHEVNIRRQHIEAYAMKHNVCPFELSFDVTLFCDCIIGDYNHVYDPKVCMKRFFGETGKKDFIILSDEAHNLVERSRDMFSAALSHSDFSDVRKQFKTKSVALHRLLGKINKWFSEMNHGVLAEESVAIREDEPTSLYMLLRDFVAKADTLLVQNDPEVGEILLALYFKTLDFLRIGELFDERYVLYLEREQKETTVKLLCLDPSYLLHQTHKKVISSIFFSATLTPLSYFRTVLGGREADFTLKLTTPFAHQNLCLLVEHTISTKYKERERSYGLIADCIFRMVSGKTGNYFVFFPSYAYLNEVLASFREQSPHIQVMVQGQNMGEEDREGFLNQFVVGNPDTLVAFVVLGGIFSEGIDLVGDRLIGAAIVGVGLPLITAERNVIADYYMQKQSNGFDYAYVYPGMNKVMQAAGRVIRSEADRGVVLLIDNRLLDSRYQQLFPPDWRHFVKVRGQAAITAAVDAFWKDGKETGKDEEIKG